MNVLVFGCLILGSIGAFCLGFLLSIAWKSLPREITRLCSLRGIRQHMQTSKMRSLRQHVEEALFQGQLDQARALICGAFANPPQSAPVESVDALYQIYLGLMTSIVNFAERRSISIEQLPVLEDLIHSRNVLLSSHRELIHSLESVRRKRRGAGKQFPGWASTDYQERIQTVWNDLEVNRLSIVSKLEDVFRNLGRSASAHEITFH